MRRPHRSRSQADYIASLEWNIRDAKEALRLALEMGNYANVKKYASQLEDLTHRLDRARRHGPRRLARAYRAEEGRRARGGRWYRPLGGGRLP